MVTRTHKVPGPVIPNLPLAGPDAGSARLLIAAVLAAGKDGCTCDACQLLKKFGGEMSSAMLREVSGGGDQNP